MKKITLRASLILLLLSAGKKDTTNSYSTKAHYKRILNGQTPEGRNLSCAGITATTTCARRIGTESAVRPAIYLQLKGNGNALAFLKK